MRSADVRRSWWAVVVVLFGVVILLGTVTAHEGVDTPGLSATGAQVFGVVTPSAGDAPVDLTQTAGPLQQVAADLPMVGASGGTDLLLHCLSVLGTCLVAVVGVLCWLLGGGRSGTAPPAYRKVAGAVQTWSRGVLPGVAPVRLRLCLCQV